MGLVFGGTPFSNSVCVLQVITASRYSVMAYTLVEFNDDSLAVVASTSVTAVNGEHSVDVGGECVVEWRARGKKNVTKHAAKVLRCGGMCGL